jgi:hypothetical protein
MDIDDPELNLRVVDWTMLMLGAPVINVDQEKVEIAYNDVIKWAKNAGDAVNSIYLTENFIKDGTLAFAKMLIGRQRIQDGLMRAKFIDYYEDGKDKVITWMEKLKEMM